MKFYSSPLEVSGGVWLIPAKGSFKVSVNRYFLDHVSILIPASLIFELFNFCGISLPMPPPIRNPNNDVC